MIDVAPLYNKAVNHVRTKVEVEGWHWEDACNDALVHCTLGLTQIADLFKSAQKKYSSQSPRLVAARDKGTDEDGNAIKA